MKLEHLGFWLLTLVILSGCATWEKHGVTANANNRIRVAVLPVEVTAEVDKASDIVSAPPEIIIERDYINAQMNEVAIQLKEALTEKLQDGDYIDVVPISEDELLLQKGATAAENTWNTEELQGLKQSHNVQAVLLVSLAGYGKMKKEWLTFLLGTGITEGLIQGVVAAKVVDNTLIGIAVALEEIGQEFLVWGGGSYLFNEHYSPVTLQAKLISTADGTRAWKDTVFVSVDKDAIKALPEDEQTKREVQLNLTAKKAIAELVDDINNSAERNIDDAYTTPSNSDQALNNPGNTASLSAP